MREGMMITLREEAPRHTRPGPPGSRYTPGAGRGPAARWSAGTSPSTGEGPGVSSWRSNPWPSHAPVALHSNPRPGSKEAAARRAETVQVGVEPPAVEVTEAGRLDLKERSAAGPVRRGRVP